MKRTFLFLVVLMLGYYGYQAFELYNRCRPLVCVTEGNISEIASGVTALVLDAGENTVIVSPQKVRCLDDRVYFVSKYALFCFHRNGKFLGQITQPEELLVADYVIDTHQQQLIVFGNEDEVWYYSVEGDLKESVRFPQEDGYSRLRSVAYHNNRLWIVKDRQSATDRYVKQIVTEYDTTLTPLNSYSLQLSEAAYKPELYAFMDPQFAVAPDNQEMYVYEASRFPEALLPDTLSICRYRSLHSRLDRAGSMSVYPVRIGNRFCFSSCAGGADRYFFCYDKVRNRCWDLQQGIKDDLYCCGQVDALFPLDLTGDSYWYAKYSDDVASGFPEAFRNNIPVLFLVEMKKG